MTKKWIMAILLMLVVQAVFVLAPASAVKRIGFLYPVQGVFVSYCTDTNTTDVPADCNYSINKSAWTDLPGASSQQVGAGSGAIIFARFSAQTQCSGGTPGAYCLIRMRLTNVGTGTTVSLQPQPAPSGIGIRFDSSSNDGVESHSAEQSVGPNNLAAGTYVVKVQVAVTTTAGGTLPTFGIKSWTLTTEVAY